MQRGATIQTEEKQFQNNMVVVRTLATLQPWKNNILAEASSSNSQCSNNTIKWRIWKASLKTKDFEKKCKEEEEVYALLERAAKTSRVIEDLQALESAELLRGADIVGMTTTAAAKNRKLVQLLGCEVVLMEEAGQVSSALLLLS